MLPANIIEKRINFTKVCYDIYHDGLYSTYHFVSFRKLSMNQAKKLCREKDDRFIPATVKLTHYTRVYHMDITTFIDHANCVAKIPAKSAIG